MAGLTAPLIFKSVFSLCPLRASIASSSATRSLRSRQQLLPTFADLAALRKDAAAALGAIPTGDERVNSYAAASRMADARGTAPALVDPGVI